LSAGLVFALQLTSCAASSLTAPILQLARVGPSHCSNGISDIVNRCQSTAPPWRPRRRQCLGHPSLKPSLRRPPTLHAVESAVSSTAPSSPSEAWRCGGCWAARPHRQTGPSLRATRSRQIFARHRPASMLLRRFSTTFHPTLRTLILAPISRSWSVAGGESATISAQTKVMLSQAPSCRKTRRPCSATFLRLLILALPRYVAHPEFNGITSNRINSTRTSRP
jgi:hypothetical protein